MWWCLREDDNHIRISSIPADWFGGLLVSESGRLEYTHINKYSSAEEQAISLNDILMDVLFLSHRIGDFMIWVNNDNNIVILFVYALYIDTLWYQSTEHTSIIIMMMMIIMRRIAILIQVMRLMKCRFAGRTCLEAVVCAHAEKDRHTERKRSRKMNRRHGTFEGRPGKNWKCVYMYAYHIGIERSKKKGETSICNTHIALQIEPIQFNI